jgi:hypothetical protein
MRKDGRDGKGIVCILFYVVLISGINMSSGALFLGWKLELWTMSSSAVSVRLPSLALMTTNTLKMLEALAVMLPSGICTVLSKMNVPSGFFWSAFGLSAGAFTISSVCLGMKRNSIFRHEWVGMIFILGFGAFLGFTPQEEFLVLLPLAVSFLLIMTRLFYPSSWDVSSVSGETLGVDEKGRARK